MRIGIQTTHPREDESYKKDGRSQFQNRFNGALKLDGNEREKVEVAIGVKGIGG